MGLFENFEYLLIFLELNKYINDNLEKLINKNGLVELVNRQSFQDTFINDL